MNNKQPKLNNRFHIAKNAKKDEFYTQLTDIEKELGHYKEYFKGKVIFAIVMIQKKVIFGITSP